MKAKITKEIILDAAFEIVQKKGIRGLSNREIAKRLNCSIRPIYYQFKNVSELNKELYTKMGKYFYKFLLDNIKSTIPAYKQVGINYIKFAQKEKNLFKALFMSDTNLFVSEFITKDEDYKELEKIIKDCTKLDDVMSFHSKMWLFTHGIATLIATNTIKFNEQEISELLSYEFKALLEMER